MPFALEQFANQPQTTTTQSIDGSTNPVTFTVASASTFPTSGNFAIIIDGEIFKVTGVSGNSFTAARAQEGTSIASHSSGAACTCVLTKRSLLNSPGPMTAVGDTIYLTATGDVGRLAVGTGLQVMGVSGGLPVWRALTLADVAADALVTDTDGATVTFDISQGRSHQVQLGGNRTLAVSNDSNGVRFTVILQQDAAGGRTISNWWSGILWQGGLAPQLSVSPNKRDVFNFWRLSSGLYLGFVVGIGF